jgi:hypothetical protein
MSKFSIDKTAPIANNVQNPYDFNGVSVSFRFTAHFTCRVSPHQAATNVAQSAHAASPSGLDNSVSVPP